ncbi:hypothetical protein SRHO_G00269330 [Serrasalmus rhombeus]
MAKKLDNGSKSTENDFENQYDSTWDDEDDEEQHDRTKVPKQQIHCTHRDLYAAKDMQNYRHMCQVPPCLDPPGPQSIKDAERSEDDEREMFNLRFYQNKIPSRPDDLYIRDFHQYWFRDYKKLENTHSYIQWLFPIQEQGVNHCAHVLTQKEIKFFRKDGELKRRLLKSYTLMLDFYGIKLLDENTGKVGHAENWSERFENLNRKTHNNLRITRILKSLGILGFEHYQAPLVHFFLTETLVRGRLPRVKRSVLDYFMFSVLNSSERKQLISAAERFSFVHLYSRFSALVSWSLGFMDESAISNPKMGHSLSSYDERQSFDTQYDSTWEDDDCPETPSSEFNIQWSRNAHRNTYAAKDMQNFRKMFRNVNCDDAADDEELGDVYSEREYRIPNLLFYQNKFASLPDGVYIKEFHEKWYGDYSRLEWVHSYIQWLFPIQEQGMNYDSQPLTPEEIKLFRKDDAAKKKLLKSYKLMLDFYGIKLLDEETGKVCRAEHWEERFKNLDRNTHNNLRITRILKCLGILGFEHYQAPLVRFFLTETLVEGRLPRVKRSVLDYFMFSVLNRSERKELIRFAFEQFEPTREFVWCPKRIQIRFLKDQKIKTRKAETPEKSRDPSGSKPCESEEIQKQNEEASNALSAQNAQNDQSSDAGKADTNPNLKMHNNQEDPPKQLSLNPDHTDTATENQNTSDTDNGNEASEAPLQGSNKPPTTASREDVEMDTDPPNQEEVSDPAATEEFVHHNSDEHSKYSEHTGFDSVSGPASNKDPSESGPSEGKESQPENGESPNAPTVQNVKNAESSGVEKETHTNQNLMTLNKKQSLKPDHPDTATENQNTSDTNKGNEEFEAQIQCNNNTPSTTGSGDNAEKMYVNEGSGSIGTDNKMDIDCSSETSAQQSDEDKKKLHASHISDDESKDERMDLDLTDLKQNCNPGATEESRHHNSTEN